MPTGGISTTPEATAPLPDGGWDIETIGARPSNLATNAIDDG